VTLSTAPEEVHPRLLKRCDHLGLATSLVPRLYEKLTEHITVVPLGRVPLIAHHSPNPRSWQFAVKHGLDRAGAALALLVLAPFVGSPALGLGDSRMADLLPCRAGGPRWQTGSTC
jgi:hypothetical protein